MFFLRVKHFLLRKKQGFTFPELLIAIALGAALLLSAAPVSTRLYGQAQLEDAERKLLQALDLTRTWTMMQRDEQQYYLDFRNEDSFFELYSFADGDTPVRRWDFDDAITFDFVDLANQFELILFNEEGMKTWPGQEMTIHIIHSQYGVKAITVNDFGLARLEEE